MNFKEGSARLRTRDKFFVGGSAQCLQASPLKFISDEESSVEGGVVEASEKSLSPFESELFGWACKCVHLEALCLRNGPPGPRMEGRFYLGCWGDV